MRLQSKRLSILSQPEAQEVYSIPVLNARDREHFFTFTEDELAAVKRLHNHRHRIYFLLMLGYFKFKPVCLKLQWKGIASDYQYIAERYFPGANLQKNTISRFVRIRYYRRIFQMLDYQRFSKELEQELLEQLFKHAAYYIDEAQLFNRAITFLELKQIAIPGYSTLQELISTAINTEETRLSKLIEKKLTNKDEFLSLINAASKPLPFNQLKKLPRTYRPGEYKSEIARHQLLLPLATKAYPLIEQLKLPEGNIRYFALRCQQYDLRDLRALKREITLLNLICFVATRFRQANDSLTMSFMIAYKDFDEQAKLYREDCVKKQALSVADALENVPQVLQLFIDDDINNTVEFGAVRDSAFDIISREELSLVCKKLSAIKPNKSQFTWEYVDNHFQKIIMNIRPLFRALDFGCRNNQSLQRQITTARSALLYKESQYKVLKRIEKDCFHEEALRKSIDSITSAAVKLPIFDDFRLSDGKSHSSADGQRFESKYGNPWVSRAPKYYAKKKDGIAYTLAASHFAVQGKVIPARSHESHHLFDLVYNNASALKSAIVSTNTHGTNQFNHAILNAFGYQFTPRYAKFKQRFLSEFSVEFTDDVMFSLAKPINWKLIRAEWKTITKIFLSLGMRTVQQSMLVKKLCSFKQHNATMQALAEYNRVFKCLHLLDYADDKQLRQVIQESLNRGEQLQGLKRALAALGNNQFRGTSPDEMTQWNACADLLANCIVYYNAMIMSSFKTYCIETGDGKQLKHLRGISPASWEHILLNGFYDLADNEPHWDIDSAIKRLDLAA